MAVSSFAQFPELGLDRGPRPKVKAVCVAGNAPHHGHIRVFPKICAAIKKAPPAGYSSHVPHNGDGALAGQPNKAPLIRSKRAIMPGHFPNTPSETIFRSGKLPRPKITGAVKPLGLAVQSRRTVSACTTVPGMFFLVCNYAHSQFSGT